jgi:hypothetical protein
MTKHTPGPWEVSTNSDGGWDVCEAGGGDMITDIVSAHSEGDAWLIAAAPLMKSVIEAGVEAVNAYAEGLLDGYALPKCLSDWLDWAEAAIRKVRGGE